MPGSTLGELVPLEVSRAAVTAGALLPALSVVSRTGSSRFGNTREAPIQEEPSSFQPARVSPGSTVQAEGGSGLGKGWGMRQCHLLGLQLGQYSQKTKRLKVQWQALLGVGWLKGSRVIYTMVRSLDFRLKTMNCLFRRQSQAGLTYCVAEDGFAFLIVLSLRCSPMPSFIKSTLGYNLESGYGVEQTELKASASLRGH